MLGKKEKRRIVLAPPYDGGYLWLLNKDVMTWHDSGGYYDGSHSYYRTLYGRDHPNIASHVASLSILYDDVFLAPADIGLPDQDSYATGSDYYNPLIGLHHNWSEYHKMRDTLEELSEEDIQNPEITALLPVEDEWSRKFLLMRLNYQSILAQQYNAKLMCGPEIRRILDIKIAKAERRTKQDPIILEDVTKIGIIDKYFDFACFHFSTPHYDDLVALKQNKDVQNYADEFHNVMDGVASNPDPYGSFIKLMNTARERTNFARQAQGGLAASGRLCTWVGLIPIAGTVAGALGADIDLATGGSQILEKRNSWFLLGPKMSEVLIEERMRNKDLSKD